MALDLDIKAYLLKIQKSFQKEIEYLKDKALYHQANKNWQEAVDEKTAYYPIQFYKSTYNVLSQKVFEFKKHQHNQQFSEGTPIYIHHKDWEKPFEGVVEVQNEDNISIVIFKLDKEWPDGSFALSLRVDERQIKLMLNQIAKALDENQNLFKKLSHFTTFESKFNEHTVLNKSQNEAFDDGITNESNTIIHGPPGTGKTKTLVAITEALVKAGKKVLIATPSNAACDNVALSLAKNGVDFLRLGNPMKTHELIQNQLPFVLFETSEAYKRVKNYQKQIQQLQQKVNQFHRKFTAEDRKNRQANRADIKELRKLIREERDYFYDKLITEKQVVCGTLIGIEKEILSDVHFDVCIIDEAGQATTPALLIPIEKAERFILAGDPLQLPPTVLYDENAPLKETLLSFYMNNKVPSHFLNTQYRMQLPIMELINKLFYDNRLISGIQNKKNEPCITFIDTSGTGFEEAVAESGSTYNTGEVETVSKYLNENKHPNAVVITPYSAQVELFQKSIPDIHVASVDSFQGSEAPTVIFSCVRSNESGNIGFLKDYRRLNVALSRAQENLIIIGDAVTLSQDDVFNTMIEWIEKNQTYRSAWEWM